MNKYVIRYVYENACLKNLNWHFGVIITNKDKCYKNNRMKIYHDIKYTI